jgi:hypothetical protein
MKTLSALAVAFLFLASCSRPTGESAPETRDHSTKISQGDTTSQGAGTSTGSKDNYQKEPKDKMVSPGKGSTTH